MFAQDRVGGSKPSVLVALLVDHFLGTQDKEERVVNKVVAHHSHDLLRCVACRPLLHDRSSKIRQHDIFAQMSVGYDHQFVLLPLAFVSRVADHLCCIGITVQQPRFDIIDYFVHSLFIIV